MQCSLRIETHRIVGQNIGYYCVVPRIYQSHTRGPILYFVPDEDGYTPTVFFYPEYYRTICVRLFHFNGEAVTNVKPVVIEYEEIQDDEGNIYKVVSKSSLFSSYEEALEYVQAEGTGNQRIVSRYPFISPIPLEAMDGYRKVYTSEQELYDYDIETDEGTIQGTVYDVKIFEYTGD